MPWPDLIGLERPASAGAGLDCRRVEAPWRALRAPAANREATVTRAVLAAAACAIAIAALPAHRAAAQQSEINKRNVVETGWKPSPQEIQAAASGHED